MFLQSCLFKNFSVFFSVTAQGGIFLLDLFKNCAFLIGQINPLFKRGYLLKISLHRRILHLFLLKFLSISTS